MKRQCALALTLVSFAVAFLIQGCENITSPQEIQKLRSEIVKLRGEVDTLKQSVNSHKGRIETLKAGHESDFDMIMEHSSKLLFLESRVKRFDSSTFDFGDKVSQRIDFPSGYFLVSVDDVKPFANGVKVTLRIGNPFAASFGEFKLKAKWGKTMPQFTETKTLAKDVDEWKKSLIEKEFTFPEMLQGGAWNYIELRLPNTKLDELGHLELSLDTTTISLNDKRRR